MKFNYDGILLASGSKDGILNVWKVSESLDDNAHFLEPSPFRTYSHSADVLCISWTNVIFSIEERFISYRAGAISFYRPPWIRPSDAGIQKITPRNVELCLN